MQGVYKGHRGRNTVVHNQRGHTLAEDLMHATSLVNSAAHMLCCTLSRFFSTHCAYARVFTTGKQASRQFEGAELLKKSGAQFFVSVFSTVQLLQLSLSFSLIEDGGMVLLPDLCTSPCLVAAFATSVGLLRGLQ